MGGSRFGRLRDVGARATIVVAVAVASCAGAWHVAAQDGASPPAVRSFAQPLLRPSTYPAMPSPAPVIPTPEAAPAPAPQLAQRATPPAAAVPLPVTPAPEPKVAPSWPKTLGDAKAEAQPPKPDAYPPDEIAAGRAKCTALLKGLDVVVIEEPSFKSGSCGAVAPVQLVSIGKSPQVALSPPVTVTCDVVVAMHQWVTKDLQPLARKHLGAALVGIDTMSSYSCRNAYGRKKTNLSEHGRANAIDIRSFTTADAREASLLADWGPTAWEIRAQVAAAAKAAAEKVAAEKLAAEKAAKARQQLAAPGGKSTVQTGSVTPPSAPAASGNGIGTIVESVPGIASRLPGAAPAAEGRNGFGLMKPSQLGGPKAAPDGKAAAKTMTLNDAASGSRKAQFLRGAHEAACKIFGTTLGPETNLAHKNHFHVDMAERSSGHYCE